MQARHSVISLAALTRCIRRSNVVNNMSAPVSRRRQDISPCSRAVGPASCSMSVPSPSSRSASARSASRASSSEVRQRNVSVRAGALAVTLSSATLVLVVIQPRRRARWLLRMVSSSANRRATISVRRSRPSIRERSVQHPPSRRIKPRRRRLGPVPGLRRVRGLRRRRTRAEDHHVYPPRRNRRNGAG
jgi:hypothetical protein